MIHKYIINGSVDYEKAINRYFLIIYYYIVSPEMIDGGRERVYIKGCNVHLGVSRATVNLLRGYLAVREDNLPI